MNLLQGKAWQSNTIDIQKQILISQPFMLHSHGYKIRANANFWLSLAISLLQDLTGQFCLLGGGDTCQSYTWALGRTITKGMNEPKRAPQSQHMGTVVCRLTPKNGRGGSVAAQRLGH